VDFEVFGELFDAGGEESDLNFGRAGVAFVFAVLLNYFAFNFFRDHWFTFLVRLRSTSVPVRRW
jgi:hypothetical protein